MKLHQIQCFKAWIKPTLHLSQKLPFWQPYTEPPTECHCQKPSKGHTNPTPSRATPPFLTKPPSTTVSESKGAGKICVTAGEMQYQSWTIYLQCTALPLILNIHINQGTWRWGILWKTREITMLWKKMTDISIVLTSQSCCIHWFICFLTDMFKPVGLHIFKMMFSRHNSRNAFGFGGFVMGFFKLYLVLIQVASDTESLKTNPVRLPKWTMRTDPTILSPGKPRFSVKSQQSKPTHCNCCSSRNLYLRQSPQQYVVSPKILQTKHTSQVQQHPCCSVTDETGSGGHIARCRT